ncbi:hypothetical protein T4E_7426 [Trichinella pseudospiralis]|uniref:Uncharacterized protein n=1 Tax=Trichinella pseudospiralis TaxID=6337 RepID=A0A0V0YNB1_TRIPS|nr:hypothetical protein T4E_7426 [Trichinella pseudospiralis]
MRNCLLPDSGNYWKKNEFVPNAVICSLADRVTTCSLEEVKLMLVSRAAVKRVSFNRSGLNGLNSCYLDPAATLLSRGQKHKSKLQT